MVIGHSIVRIGMRALSIWIKPLITDSNLQRDNQAKFIDKLPKIGDRCLFERAYLKTFDKRSFCQRVIKLKLNKGELILSQL